MGNYNNTEYTKKAKANYNAKALRSTTVQFMPKDKEALEALDELTAYYGSVAKAIKASLLANSQMIKNKKDT